MWVPPSISVADSVKVEEISFFGVVVVIDFFFLDRVVIDFSFAQLIFNLSFFYLSQKRSVKSFALPNMVSVCAFAYIDFELLILQFDAFISSVLFLNVTRKKPIGSF